MIELFGYFTKLVEEKRKNPADDLITLFANAEVDGKKLEPMDVLSWCFIIVIAGNETTRNGTSGGMLAMIQNQDQMRLLQRDPGPARHDGGWGTLSHLWHAGRERSARHRLVNGDQDDRL